MIDYGLYPRGKVVLGCFSTYSRYCGPREAVFTAICRKNLGCSHFVVGRDHTGVGQYYKDSDIRKLFDSLGDIGVTPVFYDSIGYDPASQSYQSLSEEGTLPISGTEIRDALIKNEKLPEWLIREKIQDILLAEIASGKPVFHQ